MLSVFVCSYCACGGLACSLTPASSPCDFLPGISRLCWGDASLSKNCRNKKRCGLCSGEGGSNEADGMSGEQVFCLSSASLSVRALGSRYRRPSLVLAASFGVCHGAVCVVPASHSFNVFLCFGFFVRSPLAFSLFAWPTFRRGRAVPRCGVCSWRSFGFSFGMVLNKKTRKKNPQSEKMPTRGIGANSSTPLARWCGPPGLPIGGGCRRERRGHHSQPHSRVVCLDTPATAFSPQSSIRPDERPSLARMEPAATSPASSASLPARSFPRSPPPTHPESRRTSDKATVAPVLCRLRRRIPSSSGFRRAGRGGGCISQAAVGGCGLCGVLCPRPSRCRHRATRVPANHMYALVAYARAAGNVRMERWVASWRRRGGASSRKERWALVRNSRKRSLGAAGHRGCGMKEVVMWRARARKHKDDESNIMPARHLCGNLSTLVRLCCAVWGKM